MLIKSIDGQMPPLHFYYLNNGKVLETEMADVFKSESGLHSGKVSLKFVIFIEKN